MGLKKKVNLTESDLKLRQRRWRKGQHAFLCGFQLARDLGKSQNAFCSLESLCVGAGGLASPQCQLCQSLALSETNGNNNGNNNELLQIQIVNSQTSE
jgi:hypothetical protein